MRSSVEVHNYLQSMDIKHEMVALTGSVKNSERMAELLGLDPACIMKVLVFIADGEPLMALVPGDRHANLAKIKAATGTGKIFFAAEKDLVDITDYHSRCTPPVAWKAQVTTVADAALPANSIVYTAGGQSNVVLKIRIVDLIKVTGAKLADIT